jgi:hypothetical protein
MEEDICRAVVRCWTNASRKCPFLRPQGPTRRPNHTYGGSVVGHDEAADIDALEQHKA